MRGLSSICVQDAHAADQHGHLRDRQGQKVRPVDEHLRWRQAIVHTEVVAEPIRGWFEHGEGVHTGLLLRGVRPARREWNLDVIAGLLCGLLDGSSAAEHDQVGERNLLAALLRAIEVFLDGREALQHLCQLRRIVHLPIFLRGEANTCPIGAAAHVSAAEAGGRGPGGPHQLRHREPRVEHLRLELGDILRVDQLVIDGRKRILPEKFLLRGVSAEVARAGPHIAMRKLEPRACECIGEVVRVLLEALGDFTVDRVELQREVCREHDRRMSFRRVVRVGYKPRCLAILGNPLDRPSRTLCMHPLECEQVFEVLCRPGDRVRRPGAFQAAGDGISTLAGAALVCPAHALLLEAGCGWLGTNTFFRLARAMGLSERMPACNERHGFLVVHRHTAERLADVASRRERVRFAVRSLRIDVDEAHLNRRQRLLQIAVTAVALIREELSL